MSGRNSTVYELQRPTEATISHLLKGSDVSTFWMEDVEAQRVDYPPVAGNSTTDLVIVGGGYTGLWTA